MILLFSVPSSTTSRAISSILCSSRLLSEGDIRRGLGSNSVTGQKEHFLQKVFHLSFPFGSLVCGMEETRSANEPDQYNANRE
jgi:hypothetical protein